MLRCYDSKRQNQEGWSSLHAHFRGKRHRFTTLNHKQKNLQRCRACDCAQKIFDSNKTAEGRLELRCFAARRSRVPPQGQYVSSRLFLLSIVPAVVMITMSVV